MKGAKELADMIAAEKLIVCGYEEACNHDHPYDTRTLLKALAGALEFAEPLITRLAVIDSAVPGEVVGIQQRTDEAHLWDGCPPRRCEEAEKDRVDLLAIVHSQAGIIADLRRRPAESRALRAEIERDEARAEVAQLTDRVRTMQHGEAEALKMMGSEKLMADRLATELATAKERAAKDDAGVTIHACPPKGSGIMPCCGRTPFEVMSDRMSTKPEVVNCDRVRLLTEKTATGATILKLRAEATEQRERAVASEVNAREQKGLADLAMQVVATRTQELMVAEERARVLTNGIAAYRTGGYTAAQVWENGEGKTVTR